MRKNPHDRILRVEPKEQHLNTVPKSCPFFITCPVQIYVSSITLKKKKSDFDIHLLCF